LIWKERDDYAKPISFIFFLKNLICALSINFNVKINYFYLTPLSTDIIAIKICKTHLAFIQSTSETRSIYTTKTLNTNAFYLPYEKNTFIVPVYDFCSAFRPCNKP